jgi:chemotaxis protein histidine kinase CheA/ActR/RegA family two-component response regulator
VFRDLHTVKGSSAMVGLAPFNRLAHAAEDLVGQVRDAARVADRSVVDALLAAVDGLHELAERAARGAALDLPLEPLLARLREPSAASAGAPAAEPPPPSSAAATAARQTLRVDFDKLDRLMNSVGELVLGRDELNAGIRALASLGGELSAERQRTRRLAAAHRRGELRAARGSAAPARDPLLDLGDELGRVERVLADLGQELDHAAGRLDSVSDDLRDQVMKLRMVPIGGTFRKHHRTVRDLAQALGKRARIELVGEDTELDKVLVELLDEPLMHLVRNAVDHGVEPPDRRLAAGKPAEAVITLRARHEGNQIVIEIEDDGAGIDAEALCRRAIERRMCDAAEVAAMDHRQRLALIFRAGLSTATAVSEISGRGVGMDVVHATIVGRAKGQVEVESALGRGARLTLRLPLTLAIIQVLLARCAGEVFAVPLDAIVRTLSRRADEVARVQDRELVAVHGRQVPLVRLARVLALGGDSQGVGELLHVILVEHGGETYGLAVDHLLGKKEIVIKSLGELLRSVPCAAGATLLGDRPALILDLPGVLERALREPQSGMMAQARPRRATAEIGDDAPHVLVVEDSDTVRESLRRLMVAAGYRCTTAPNGAAALELARREIFDLVSTDVMMPRVDGYELTRALRALPSYRDVPIVMVTSRGERIDRVRGFDAGVDEYITKPHDRQQLQRTIARLLAGRGGNAS